MKLFVYLILIVIVLQVFVVTFNENTILVSAAGNSGDDDDEDDPFDGILDDDEDGAGGARQLVAIKKDVVKRNLVRENIKPTSILQNHFKYCKDTQKRKFKGNVLGYITPWNSKGYKIAELFKCKFTHLSPVWFQVKFFPGKGIGIEGGHNIDKEWIKRIRSPMAQCTTKTKIVPRYNMEGDGWTIPNFEARVKDGSLVSALSTHVKDNGFDGLVLEGYLNPQIVEIRNQFIEKLSKSLHQIDKQLFIVIPPIRDKKHPVQMFTGIDYALLANFVDGFSFMTYDYSPGTGSNSPYPWVVENIKMMLQPNEFKHPEKLMIGIPFYGYKGGATMEPSPVVSHDFIDILKKNKNSKFTWNQFSHDHIFLYSEQGSGTKIWLNYPSLLFIDQHIKLAKEYSASISIWELGQGLDYFYDLL
eukprot:gene7944-9774_t